MIRTLSLLLLLLVSFYSFNQDPESHSVYFDVAKHNLKSDERARLDKFISSLYLNEIEFLQLSGHTDSDGSDEYNNSLSARRVSTVAEYLRKNGIKVDESNPYGESKPAASNDNVEGKTKNRRVDITIDYAPMPMVMMLNDIQDLYKRTSKKNEEHCIQNDRDTNLLLKEGTIIYFPANCFPASNSCITIEAKEIYKQSDMILENLSTTSDGIQLESGGMIYLKATNSRGQELKPLKEISIFMPSTDPKSDMKLFSGTRDQHDVMNWQGLDVVPQLIDTDQMDRCSNNQTTDCNRCKFFMCRIGRIGLGIKGIVSSEQRRTNSELRKCQRKLKRMRNVVQVPVNEAEKLRCDSINALFKSYSVDNYRDLVMKMNQTLMDSLGLKTYEELLVEKEKQRVRKMESDIASGNSNAANLSYYSFQTTQMGWINCDRFTKYPDPKITMRTSLKQNTENDCKLVFQKIKSVMPGSYQKGDNFYFPAIPKGEPVRIVGIKYIERVIYLSIQTATTGENAPEFDFKKVSLEELKEKLKVLD